MLKQRNFLVISQLVAGVLLASTSFAEQQAGWFFGLSVNRPQVQLDLPTIQFARKDDSGYKLVAGYRFGPHWQAEINYVDISRSQVNLDSHKVFALPPTYGTGLQLVGTASMAVSEKMGVFGKLGASHSALENTCSTIILTCTAIDRGADLSYGVGLRYDFTKTVGVQGEWERLRRFGNRDAMGDADRDFFSVGMGFKF